MSCSLSGRFRTRSVRGGVRCGIVEASGEGITRGSGLCRGPSYPGRVLNHPREAVPGSRPAQSGAGAPSSITPVAEPPPTLHML